MTATKDSLDARGVAFFEEIKRATFGRAKSESHAVNLAAFYSNPGAPALPSDSDRKTYVAWRELRGGKASTAANEWSTMRLYLKNTGVLPEIKTAESVNGSPLMQLPPHWRNMIELMRKHADAFEAVLQFLHATGLRRMETPSVSVPVQQANAATAPAPQPVPAAPSQPRPPLVVLDEWKTAWAELPPIVRELFALGRAEVHAWLATPDHKETFINGRAGWKSWIALLHVIVQSKQLWPSVNDLKAAPLTGEAGDTQAYETLHPVARELLEQLDTTNPAGEGLTREGTDYVRAAMRIIVQSVRHSALFPDLETATAARDASK